MKCALAIIGLLSGTLSFLIVNDVQAASSTFQLDIAPKKCTIDTLNTGVSQYTVLRPEECQMAEGKVKLGHKQVNEDTVVPSDGGVTRDTHPGDQLLAEDTIFEPLAAWVGWGDQEAAPVRPVATSIALATGVGMVADAALFQSQGRHKTLRALRRLKTRMKR